MHSALYHGWLDHRRLVPRRHAFRYGVFMVYLDLDELDEVFRGRWFWSTRRPALARFDRDAHLGDPVLPLHEAVRSLVARHTGRRPAGPVRLLTNLRYWGYGFNPVSFYYCFDAEGRAVEAVVAEVSNTPWGERHCYVLPQDRPGAEHLQAESTKAMHVSPFHPMSLAYSWQLGTPGDALDVHMSLRPCSPDGATDESAQARGQGAVVFGATLALQRVPITGRTLAGTLLRFPCMTAKVIAAIHWEALRLWLKRTPVFDHPGRSEADRLLETPSPTSAEPHR